MCSLQLRRCPRCCSCKQLLETWFLYMGMKTLHWPQVTWLRHFLGKEVVAWLMWGGLRVVPSRAGALESVLRMKFLLLFAITLKRRSFRSVPRDQGCRLAEAC